MRLGKYLSSLTKPELEELKGLLNLTDDEEMVFIELSKGRSVIYIAEKCMVCTSTVDNRTKAIKYKMNKLGVKD
jgi:DNA-binding NarL/FixJ family response regulator